jgi:hypothetical protein
MTLEVPKDLQYGLLDFIAHINAEDFESLPEDFVNLGFTPPNKLEQVSERKFECIRSILNGQSAMWVHVVADEHSPLRNVGEEERSHRGACLHVQTAEQRGRALENEGEV